MTPTIEIAESVRGRLRAHAIWAEGAELRDDRAAYDAMEELAAELREAHGGKTVGQVEGVGEARRLYREFGIDPTRTRPSSEALLRRALQGKSLYHINNVVDVGNLSSLRALLPLGLYDREFIQSEKVELRVGHMGEGYEGIRKGRVNVEQRLCLADESGAFGSPTSDSLRTSIRESTRDLLVVVFAPADGDPARLAEACQSLMELLTRWCSARIVADRYLD